MEVNDPLKLVVGEGWGEKNATLDGNGRCQTEMYNEVSINSVGGQKSNFLYTTKRKHVIAVSALACLLRLLR